MLRIFNLNNIDKNYKKLVIFIILSWLALWFSIDTYVNFIQIKDLKKSIIPLFNDIRVFIAFSTIFISTTLILYLVLKKKLRIFNKTNYILILLLLYFFLQIIGLKTNSEKDFNIRNLYLIVLAIGSLNIFLIVNLLELTKILKFILYLSITLLALFLIFLIFRKIILSEYSFYIDLHSLIHPEEKFLNRELPRVTGVSRMLAVINIVLIIFLEFNTKLKSILLLILAVFFSSMIWGMQSRGTILCFFISLLIICFYLKNLNFKKSLYLFFILSFLPAIIFENLRPIIFKKNYEYYKKVELEKKKQEILNNESKQLSTKEKIPIRVFEEKTTSGRLIIWKTLIDLYEKNRFFGYGPQADRFLLKWTEEANRFSSNASNGVIYAFVCGGYLAAFIIILIYIKTFSYIYFFFKKNYLKKMHIFVKISIIFLIFFSIRSLVENSFTLFSVDFLLFLLSITIIENFIKKNKI